MTQQSKAAATRNKATSISGEGGTGTGNEAAQQALVVTQSGRALVNHEDLMECLCSRSNLIQAFKRVKRNKGSAGVDRKTIAETEAHLLTPGVMEKLITQLLSGKYHPMPIRGVQIPKPDGGIRQLGIPTVIDRMIQQALLQVLTPIYDPHFSESSFGFRPRRNAQQALQKATEHVANGKTWVVDLDLERFFDQVNHDRLMYKMSITIKDKRILKLIRRYLQAGLLQDGLITERQSGTPQGGPLSPLLSNIVLDELDKELEKRGHCFCRYADDCNIYVNSQKAADRVKASITAFIEGKMKLNVNSDKSASARVSRRQFLGYRIYTDASLGLSPKTMRRFRNKVIKMTKRNRGCSLQRVINDLNRVLRGWMAYFKLINSQKPLKQLDGWIRRRLRCLYTESLATSKIL